MSKPDYLPLWATSTTTLPATGQTNKVRPKESLQTIGWDMGQIPTAEEWNWQFNNMYLWIEYFADLYANATDLATADTLALRDDTGSLNFYNLYVDNNLEVDGASSFTGASSFSGDVSLVKLSATGSITSSGSNTWSGNNTFSGAITFTGDITADKVSIENLTVSTEAVFSSTVNITGAITSSGSNIWSGAQSFTGTLNSSGNNTWNGTNSFSAAVTFTSTITISGTSTFSGAIVSTGTNTFSGVNTFSNKLNLQSSNLSSNGYTYLPNGVIMQWGYVALSDMIQFNDYEGYSTVTLPIAFPTGFLGGSCTVKTSQVSADSDCWGQIAGTPSKTQITVQIQNAGETTFSYIDGVYWTAIGN